MVFRLLQGFGYTGEQYKGSSGSRATGGLDSGRGGGEYLAEKRSECSNEGELPGGV